jgi:hypothetical protein
MKTLIAAAGLMLGLATTAQAATPTCDRACLRATLDTFIGAVLAHDPARAPLAIGFRQTQNAVITPAGGGIWKTITALGSVQRRYVDPVTGNAEFFGLVMEGDKPAVASARIRIEGREITEAEWHVARKGDTGMAGTGTAILFDPEGLEKLPPPDRVVPRAQRLPREALQRIVSTYFDGLVNGSGRTVLAHGGCARLENGFNVSGRPLPPERKDDGFEGKGDCTSGYAQLHVANVAARRYLVIDEEAQAVVMSAVFIRTPGDRNFRNTFMEVFSIDGGRIRSVHAAMFYGAPNLPVPNWPPFEPNFPLVPMPAQ